jgi:hypothetical protein
MRLDIGIAKQDSNRKSSRDLAYTRATDSPGDAAAPAGANTDLRKRGERARRIVGSA